MLQLTERLGMLAPDAADDTLTLIYDDRIKGRLRVTLDSGRGAGLFLDRGPVLRDGQGLAAADGTRVRVMAASEAVVTARVVAGLPLARLAYHLGNRHVTLALGEDAQGGWVRFAADHVLEDLALRLGASLEHHEAPFDPEPGAYAMAPGGHSHGHDHGHGHGHGHDHAHAH
ncbi:urease accessory protein UreE [Halomonas sp. V046]|uniref:urease accessory protein UreE n=1 Tax=Halomonas sp. V046 TaxID=3459611 RepID=UPI0040449B4F